MSSFTFTKPCNSQGLFTSHCHPPIFRFGKNIHFFCIYLSVSFKIGLVAARYSERLERYHAVCQLFRHFCLELADNILQDMASETGGGRPTVEIEILKRCRIPNSPARSRWTWPSTGELGRSRIRQQRPLDLLEAQPRRQLAKLACIEPNGAVSLHLHHRWSLTQNAPRAQPAQLQTSSTKQLQAAHATWNVGHHNDNPAGLL